MSHNFTPIERLRGILWAMVDMHEDDPCNDGKETRWTSRNVVNCWCGPGGEAMELFIVIRELEQLFDLERSYKLGGENG